MSATLQKEIVPTTDFYPKTLNLKLFIASNFQTSNENFILTTNHGLLKTNQCLLLDVHFSICFSNQFCYAALHKIINLPRGRHESGQVWSTGWRSHFDSVPFRDDEKSHLLAKSKLTRYLFRGISEPSVFPHL